MTATLSEIVSSLIHFMTTHALRSACHGFWVSHDGADILVHVCVQAAGIGTDVFR
jgi:hypothetical protein